MKHYCALCGRPMLDAAVMIGQLPVGPVCARRAGLLQLAKKRAGLVKVAHRHAIARAPAPRNLGLFEVAA